ncbi:MAG: pyruvate, phosphate dikinase [Treponema sp.]|jgi:pyruvate,orthophosphate dikinase|nr:pyruvate, phosphate dikinase [Treponema sp.]
MDKRIHFFSQRDLIPRHVAPELLGIRGRQANEFAELAFPILPGIIIDSRLASRIDPREIKKDALAQLEKIAAIMGKRFGDPENPLFLKVVISPNLAVSTYPPLHNFGLVKSVLKGFVQWAGKDFVVREALFLIRGMLKIEERLRELEAKAGEREEIAAQLKVLEGALGMGEPSQGPGKKEESPAIKGSAEFYMDFYAKYLPPGFFEDAEAQLFAALTEISRMFQIDDRNDNDTALIISPMVYGNYGENSRSGVYFSRNPVSGEKVLWGSFYRGDFNAGDASGQPIGKIGAAYLGELQRIAWALEDKFREIRQIRFTIENGKLWLIEQRPAEQKSIQADIKLLLDLVKRKIISGAEAVKAVDPSRLNDILHPVIDPSSVKGFKRWRGGLAGAPGAAIGRAYFSTGALLEALRLAQQKGEDPRFILILESSFAEDVKAIEVSAGVLTVQGGYSAHASVVARQYGKVSLVAREMSIKGKRAFLPGGLSFKEGDSVTLNAPFYGQSQIFLGEARLIEPDPKESGLMDFIALSRGFIKTFQVRCNADTPRDAALGLSFGAGGIGLCRTEHMFFQAERINLFREMLFAANSRDRAAALAKLQVTQRNDFYQILKIMAGKEVTIRLLDSPLHEFMPHTEDEIRLFMDHLRNARGRAVSRGEVTAAIEALHEFNPMLGRRGCRVAVSYPEIYAMQIRAVFEAAYRLRAEKIDARPEIMVPIVMNASELKLIAYGKKIEGSSYPGVVDIEEELRARKKVKPLEYRIGAMIELPAAALGAGEIAKYGRFFSFGTNDLTQTTLGISRDDFTAFMPDYTRFDLFQGNPFSVLDPRVKELIVLAVERGRLTRPDLVCGLCGEHGANPEDTRFCVDAGLDYVSCSPYSVPIALLAAAQAELDRA